ncbi:ribonuclease domain-containing protein [Corynebacterium suicordis]
MNLKNLKRLAPLAIAAIAATGWIGAEAIEGFSDSSSDHSTQQQGQGGNNNDASNCEYDSLPAEAQDQIEDILANAAPDDGSADGKHFGNYEGLLPKQKSSYYREYTVRTPGVKHRGERRIVVGGGSKTDPDVWYYSGDHFESFCSIPDAEE